MKLTGVKKGDGRSIVESFLTMWAPILKEAAVRKFNLASKGTRVGNYDTRVPPHYYKRRPYRDYIPRGYRRRPQEFHPYNPSRGGGGGGYIGYQRAGNAYGQNPNPYGGSRYYQYPHAYRVGDQARSDRLRAGIVGATARNPIVLSGGPDNNNP